MNAQLAAMLVKKAAELKSQVDETKPPPDKIPRPPEVEMPRMSGAVVAMR